MPLTIDFAGLGDEKASLGTVKIGGLAVGFSNAIIAEPGAPVAAFASAADTVAANQASAFAGKFLTDAFGAGGTYDAPTSLRIRFSTPVSEVVFDFADIDGGETFLVHLRLGDDADFDGIDIRAGSAGTGDGIVTRVACAARGVSELVYGVVSSSGGGWGLDSLSFTKVSAPGGSLPAVLAAFAFVLSRRRA